MKVKEEFFCASFEKKRKGRVQIVQKSVFKIETSDKFAEKVLQESVFSDKV